MRYRQLGKWGVRVSEITLGTWLTHGGHAAIDIATESTRAAYELGINLFDTANVYPEGNEGAAEEVLGLAVTQLPRDTYILATKVFSPMGDSPLQRGLSRKHITSQVDGSLRRLKLDYIDLYQCHRYDAHTPLEETAAVMNDLVQRGKILYWGVSEWSADQIEDAVSLCENQGWAAPVSNQPHYSLLWRKPEEGVLPICKAIGMGILAFAPLAHGILTGKYGLNGRPPIGSRGDGQHSWMLDRYFTESALRAVQEFRSLATEAGYTAAQLALGWCLHNDAVSSVIVGASQLSQLQENVAIAEIDFEPHVIAKASSILDPVRLS